MCRFSLVILYVLDTPTDDFAVISLLESFFLAALRLIGAAGLGLLLGVADGHDVLPMIVFLVYAALAAAALWLPLLANRHLALRLFEASALLDGFLVGFLLWHYPSQPVLGLLVPCALLLAVVHRWSAFALVVEGFLLLSVALIQSYMLGDLQGSQPQPVHVLSAFLSVLAIFLAYGRVEAMRAPSEQAVRVRHTRPTHSAEQRAIAHLEQALQYLQPLHLRNHLPISILLLRSPMGQAAEVLRAHLQQRLRHSDLLCVINEQHWAILLPDTDEQGGQALARQIALYCQEQPWPQVAMAVCQLPPQPVALQVVLNKLAHGVQQPGGASSQRIGLVRILPHDLD